MTGVCNIVGLTLDYRSPIRTSNCIKSMIDAGITRIVVVDNSAYPQSFKAVQSHQADFPQATIIELVQYRNLGFSAGVNTGLAEINRHWPCCPVLLLNNDATIGLELPVRLLEALDSDISVVVAYPAMRQQGVRYQGAWYQPWLGLISVNSMPFAVQYASGCCQLIAPNRCPGALYDERFFMYGEDVALAWSLRQRGLRQVLVASCEVEHEGSASSGNGSLFYETLLVDSHFRLVSVLSAGNPFRFVLYFGARCFTLPVRALVRALRLRRLTPLMGLIAGIGRALRGTRGPPGESADEY